MQQRKIPKEENEQMLARMVEVMKMSRRTNEGFAFENEKVLKTFDHDEEERRGIIKGYGSR